MKNKTKITLIAFLNFTSIFLMGILSTNAQDSLRVRNRHDVPDTTRDTTKLDGGALIDTIHIDKENKLPGIERTDTSSQIFQDHNIYVYQADERKEKITDLEKRIVILKTSLSSSSPMNKKTELASLENKKNDLKSRLDSENATDIKEKDKWNKDYSDLVKKLDSYK